MTKQETTLLLEAVKNAPIVDGTIMVTVCGTTFSFGNKWHKKITENNRDELLGRIGQVCRARMTRSASKRELSRPAIRSQELMLWWKDNINKTEEVFQAVEIVKAYHDKWNDYDYARESECKKDYYKMEIACEKIGVSHKDVEKLAALRSSVPKAWEKA